MSTPVLQLKDVAVTYTDDPVIRDINIEVKAGEIYGIMGLNGAGKTSMIKSVLGLKNQSHGDISIFGHDKASALGKNQLAYLPEKFEPPWFLTGMEFLKFSMRLYKKDFAPKVMEEAAEKLALDPAALKRKVNTYSKGMRQKLGLMGTLLTDCPLMILDEPMSGLDPKARALVKKMIVEMKSKERAIFLCSHILSDMDEICNRVALLNDGAIQFIGTPAALKKQTKAGNLEQAFLDFIEKKAAA